MDSKFDGAEHTSVADWLHGELVAYCRSVGLVAATQTSLFEIVERAREVYPHPVLTATDRIVV